MKCLKVRLSSGYWKTQSFVVSLRCCCCFVVDDDVDDDVMT